jgi:hypothetical protein
MHTGLFTGHQKMSDVRIAFHVLEAIGRRIADLLTGR